MPEDELDTIEETEEQDQFNFMVEDKDDVDRACLTCERHKVDNKVCGIFKCYNDFIVHTGGEPIEDRFSCSEYKEV